MSIAVVDAVTVVDLICGFPAAEPFRGVLASADAAAAPAHLDAEVFLTLGRLKRAGQLSRADEWMEALAAFGATRWPLQPLLLPAWAVQPRTGPAEPTGPTGMR